MRTIGCLALVLVGCSAATHTPYAGSAPEGSGGSSTGGSIDPGAGSGDPECGGVDLQASRVPPNVMLVLDRSSSMSETISDGSPTTKWKDLKTAVELLVGSYDAQMRLGVTLYSAGGECGAGEITPFGDLNGATVLSEVNAHNPGGRTPTAETLARVLREGHLDDPGRENVVVLATDGESNCGDDDVTGKIDALYQATPPVRTFVIGIGDGTASNPTLLGQWADAGHTARAGDTHYYQTNSPDELKAAFDAIAGGVVSCTFHLAQTPPDPSQLYVYANGTRVAPDEANGYSYDDGTQSLTLHGAACDQVRADPAIQLQVVYGCPIPLIM